VREQQLVASAYRAAIDDTHTKQSHAVHPTLQVIR